LPFTTFRNGLLKDVRRPRAVESRKDKSLRLFSAHQRRPFLRRLIHSKNQYRKNGVKNPGTPPKPPHTAA
jgi:hypothetical protein